MAIIADIIVYPIKSCAGMSLESAEITETGLALDRCWMLIDADNVAVTQREQPLLALVKPSIVRDGLLVRAPDMAEIIIPFGHSGVEVECSLFGETSTGHVVSEDVSAWFSRYLDLPVRLVRKDPESYRAGGVQYPARDDSPTNFVDNYSILVIGKASLDDLNQHMAEPVSINRFRPNIVLGGTDAFAEDFVESASSGGVELRFTNICYRCTLTNVNQETAEVTDTTFDTLSSRRKVKEGVKFGNYAAVEKGLGLRIDKGAEIDLAYGF